MVPVLTILTFVGLIGLQLVYAYAKKRTAMMAEVAPMEGHGFALYMQDGGEPIDGKKEEKTEKAEK